MYVKIASIFLARSKIWRKIKYLHDSLRKRLQDEHLRREINSTIPAVLVISTLASLITLMMSLAIQHTSKFHPFSLFLTSSFCLKSWDLWCRNKSFGYNSSCASSSSSILICRVRYTLITSDTICTRQRWVFLLLQEISISISVGTLTVALDSETCTHAM